MADEIPIAYLKGMSTSRLLTLLVSPEGRRRMFEDHGREAGLGPTGLSPLPPDEKEDLEIVEGIASVLEDRIDDGARRHT